MNSDIEVTDVRVQFGDRPPESISDRADFEVSNTTFIPALRLDAWVLPFLNLYLMAGGGTTDTSLRTLVAIDPPIGEPVEIEVVKDEQVEGGMLGVGATTVVGGDNWFAMLDANYSRLDVDAFDDGIDAWLYSARLGWHGPSSWGPARAWGGLMYMESGRTLQLSEDFPVIGNTRIEVDQQPVDPLTFQFGASVTVSRNWDLLVEVGSNFDDAFVAVASCAYRF